MHFQRSISLPLAALLVLSQMPELHAGQSAHRRSPQS
jgi:hypothetical protein